MADTLTHQKAGPWLLVTKPLFAFPPGPAIMRGVTDVIRSQRDLPALYLLWARSPSGARLMTAVLKPRVAAQSGGTLQGVTSSAAARGR